MLSFYRKYRSFVEKQALKQFKNGRNVVTDSGLISVFAGISLISFTWLIISSLDGFPSQWQFFAVTTITFAASFLLFLFVLRTSHNIRKYANSAFKRARKGSLFFEYSSQRIPVGEGNKIINVLHVKERYNNVVEVNLNHNDDNNFPLLYEIVYKCKPSPGKEIILSLGLSVLLFGSFRPEDVINYFVRDHHERDTEDGDGFPLSEKFDLVTKLEKDIMKILHSKEVENTVMVILKKGFSDTDYSLSATQRWQILNAVTMPFLNDKNPSFRNSFSNFVSVSMKFKGLSSDNPEKIVDLNSEEE
jgi:Ca2+/Na+ antiporter